MCHYKIVQNNNCEIKIDKIIQQNIKNKWNIYSLKIQGKLHELSEKNNIKINFINYCKTKTKKFVKNI